MPLLKRKAVELVQTPLQCDTITEDVWQIRYTGEIFLDYLDYVNRVNLYRQRIWSCRYTNKGNFTFEEALMSERAAQVTQVQLPESMHRAIATVIHGSTDRLDHLADKIHAFFENAFATGESVLAHIDTLWYPVKLLFPCDTQGCALPDTLTQDLSRAMLQAPAPNNTKKESPLENGSQQQQPPLPSLVKKETLTDNHSTVMTPVDEQDIRVDSLSPPLSSNGPSFFPANAPSTLSFTAEFQENTGEGTVVVSVARLARKRLAFSKDLLKRAIREMAARPSSHSQQPWIVHSDVAQRYQLPSVLHSLSAPPSSSSSLNRDAERKRASKKRKRDEKRARALATTTDPAQESLKIQKQNAVSEHGHLVAKQRPLLPTLIQETLQEDTLLSSRMLPMAQREDAPATQLLLSSHCFLLTFARAIHLSPFTLDDLTFALRHESGTCVLLFEIHASLLRLIASKYRREPELLWHAPSQSRIVGDDAEEGDADASLRAAQKRRLNDLLGRFLNESRHLDAWERVLIAYVHLMMHCRKIRGEMQEKEETEEEEHWQWTLASVDYVKWPMEMKLAILSTLIEDALDTEAVREYLEDSFEEWMEMRKALRATQNQQKKLRREAMKESKERLKNGKSLGKKEEKWLAEKEADEKRMERRKEHYERNLAKLSVQRVQPLGKDRHHAIYWYFDLVDMDFPSGRIFVEMSDGSWFYYDQVEQVNDLISAMNERGIRESGLKRNLQKHYERIVATMKKRQQELMLHAKTDELRRSSRIKTTGRAHPYMQYVNRYAIA